MEYNTERRDDPRGRPKPDMEYNTKRRGDPCDRPETPMEYNTERKSDIPDTHKRDPYISAGQPTSRPECPYCRSTDTELFSLFGQQLLTVQYYCNTCHTPFERVKDGQEPPPRMRGLAEGPVQRKSLTTEQG